MDKCNDSDLKLLFVELGKISKNEVLTIKKYLSLFDLDLSGLIILKNKFYFFLNRYIWLIN